VFVPLAIRSDFLDDELAKAPQCIKDLPEAKKRESDEGIRLVLLEVLLMIGSTRNGRERMRNDQVVLSPALFFILCEILIFFLCSTR